MEGPINNELKYFARRLSNYLTNTDYLSDGLATTEPERWREKDLPIMSQAVSIMYLAYCLSILEIKFGKNCWNKKNSQSQKFDEYLKTVDYKNRKKIMERNLSQALGDILICIRNAVIHNDGDLGLNCDKKCFEKVQKAEIRSVVINGSKVSFEPKYYKEFIETVRLFSIFAHYFYSNKPSYPKMTDATSE